MLKILYLINFLQIKYPIMSEDTLLIICIVGTIVSIILIIVIANYLDIFFKKKKSMQFKKDIENGTYNKNKNYFGNQGKWETDEYSDNTNAPPN